MATIESRISDIPLEELEQVEDFAFDMLHMDREMVMDQFDDVYEDTGERCRENLKCQGMYRCFPLARIEGGTVEVEGGTTFESQLLAKVLAGTDEVVLYAATVHGYEELAKDPSNSTFDGMFFDAWGVGYTMAAHRWVRNAVESAVRAAGRFAGRGWVPGEGDLELSLMKGVFALLDPAAIGLELPDSGLMHPVMSVCGIMGISDDPAFGEVGKDIVELH